MRIANPMYDVVFKHLLEDLAAARLLIGAIIEEEIEEIDIAPQENTVLLSRTTPEIRIQRIDFAATVRTAGGERMRVLIEVQKSHYSEDVARFRSYLGRHYSDRTAYVMHASSRQPLKLLAIYFLGRRLPNTEATVLKVARQYLDAVTGERLIRREDFVEALSHDCYVVQVSRLPERRRNDLEKLLSVFDQTLRTDDLHVLEVDETTIPAAYRPVLRRLEAAAASREVAESMEFEDEVVEAWERQERAIAERDETIAEHEETIAARDETIERLQAELATLRQQRME